MLNDYEDILTVSDVAQILYIGKNRVYELLDSGDLKGFRIGRVWKIPKEAVQEYILVQSRLKQSLPDISSPNMKFSIIYFYTLYHKK